MLQSLALVSVVLSITAGEALATDSAAHAALRFNGLNAAGDVRLAIDPASIAALQQARRSTIRLGLSAVEDLALDLRRFEVFAPDARFVRATSSGASLLAPPRIVFLRGEVAGESNSHVFLALSEDQPGAGLGVITRGSGERWHIGVDRSDPNPGLIARRGVGDVPDFDEFCRVVHLDHHAGGSPEGLPADAARGPRVLNVAVETDHAYWQIFDNDQAALSYIAMVLGAVSDIYIRDLNFSLALRFARIWPQGGEPVSADDLEGFYEYWQKNEDLTGLNLVHMFSGTRATSYGGIAYISDACTQEAFGISAFMLGGFPSPIIEPNLGNWDVNVVAHEMGHNLGTFHTHDYEPPVDTCAFGSEERGTIMSYCHTRAGGLLNIDMRMHGVTQDVIVDANPSGTGSCLWHDCNGNLINDLDDIARGASPDINGDSIPDECQDCNSNSVLDPFEIALGLPDVNGNGVPDSCENDCNANGLPDRFECAQGIAADVNGNRVPDACEPDCDGNGVADFLDIASGTHIDLDRNSRPDVCDDCNGNGVSDWLDVDRAFDVFVAQSPFQTGKLVDTVFREYHAASGVLVQAPPVPSTTNVWDLTVGPDRQVYLAGHYGLAVVRVNVDAGTSGVFASGVGMASGLTFGPDGNLYVADFTFGHIRKYNGITGAPMGIVVQGGPVGPIDHPVDLLFLPNGQLLVLMLGGVRVVDVSNGALVFGFPTNLMEVRGMCRLPNGDLLITSHADNKVQRFSAAGVDLGQWNDDYPMNAPWGITLGPHGHVFVARMGNPARIIEYTQDGHYIRSFIRGDADLVGPTSIAFRPASPNDTNANLVPDVCESTCLGDIAPPPGNGQVNVDDLLAVILSWGECHPVLACAADIAPPAGDGQVDVDDLLGVIVHWGACP